MIVDMMIKKKGGSLDWSCSLAVLLVSQFFVCCQFELLFSFVSLSCVGVDSLTRRCCVVEELL